MTIYKTTQVLGIIHFIGLHVAVATVQFTTQPVDTAVIQGQDATLNCAVSGLPEGTTFNPAWLKTGQALTSGRDVGGHARYSIIGDPATEGNLQIAGALLEDDDFYQCKISPLDSLSGPNASSVAHLTVQVPPEAPSIENYANGTSIVLQPPEQVVLKCIANNAKPVAAISWLKAGDPLVHDTPVVEVTPGGSTKLFSISSTLTLNPEKEDNGMEYKCIVSHPAVPATSELTVSLDVQFAPDPPSVTPINFVETNKVRAGTVIELRCVSRGGNPLANVYWWKNDVQLDFSYQTDGTSAWNIIPVTVDRTDNGARYVCKVTNVVQQEPLTAEIILDVIYPPAFVNITGHEEMVKAGDIVTLTCTSAPSNPASTIQWTESTQGANSVISEQVTTGDTSTGFISTSTLTLNMSMTEYQVAVECQALNGGEIASHQVFVSVMYPPDTPVIRGDLVGLRTQQGLRLHCSAFRGNPLADLTWYKNGEPVVTASPTMAPTVKSGSTASRELVFLLDKSDNGANYTCNASNAATTQPLQALVTLSVNFLPESMTVTALPEAAKEGENVTLTCATSSSYPASDVSWWRGSVPVAGSESVVESAEFGGFITRSVLNLTGITSADNGAVIKCQASNDVLPDNKFDAITLDIKFKPQISSANGTTITSGEDHNTHTLECSAKGNPEDITHTWKLNDATVDVTSNPRLSLSDTGALVIQNLTRSDHGKYMCLVSNTEGSSNISATIDVSYSPLITTGATVTVTLYSSGEIVCEADANPKPANFVKWVRQGFDISKFTHEYADGKAILKMPNVTLADAGLYTCEASNGIEPSVSKDIQVVVHFKPEIDQKLPQKVAQSAGQTAILKCGAVGAPEVRFTWQQNGAEINMTADRYSVDMWADLKYSNRYESRLIIGHVNEALDYADYQCKAKNSLGEAVVVVKLEKTSPPDAPSEPTVVEVSHISLTLSWVPGFDGGLQQSFVIRYNRKGSTQYNYVDVSPPNATIFTVENLASATEYEVTVRGKNSLGPGPFYAGIITAVTDAKPTSQPRPPTGILVGNLPLYLFLLIVFLILMSCVFLNIFLCCCLFKRRKTKKDGTRTGVQLERVRRESSDSAPTETRSIDSLSQRDSDRDRGYSSDEASRGDYDRRSYDSRRYRDEYSIDSRDYSVSDYRPFVHRGSRDYRQPDPLYNTGYRPPSYAPSWDSYGTGPLPSISGMTADSRISEEQDEKDYIAALRRKQQDGRLGALQRGVDTPSPVPSSLGNFVPLSKRGSRGHGASVAGSEDGFLV